MSERFRLLSMGIMLGVLGSVAALHAPPAHAASKGISAMIQVTQVKMQAAADEAEENVDRQRELIAAMKRDKKLTYLDAELRHLARYEQQNKALKDLEFRLDELRGQIARSKCK